MKEPDMVNHPAHYTQHPSGVEVITITEHMNFNLGNVIKYTMRADYKGKPLEDLKKAQFYLEREISLRESKLKSKKRGTSVRACCKCGDLLPITYDHCPHCKALRHAYEDKK